jgi:hypothetical protein
MIRVGWVFVHYGQLVLTPFLAFAVWKLLIGVRADLYLRGPPRPVGSEGSAYGGVRESLGGRELF